MKLNVAEPRFSDSQDTKLSEIFIIHVFTTYIFFLPQSPDLLQRFHVTFENKNFDVRKFQLLNSGDTKSSEAFVVHISRM